MNLKDSGWEDMDWISLDQHRDKRQASVNMVMNQWEPKSVRNFLTSLFYIE